MRRYRELLRIPGVPLLWTSSIMARLPSTMRMLALPVFVTASLGKGLGAAGLVGGLFTLGSAIGSPWLGRLTDHRGLRATFTVVTVAETAFWVAVPWMSYPVLVGCALFAGVLAAPAGTGTRTAIAAMVPGDQQRQAFALDAVVVEICYILGGPLFTVLSGLTDVSVTLRVMAVLTLIGSGGFALLNPPTPRQLHGDAEGDHRLWRNPALLSQLFLRTSTFFVIMGAELALLGILRQHGMDNAHLIGVLFGCWAVYSMIGSFLYGLVPHSIPQKWIIGLQAGLAVLACFSGDSWWTTALLIAPMAVLTGPAVASFSEALTTVVSPRVLGQAAGMSGTAGTLGGSLGTIVVGFAVDHTAPVYGPLYAAAGGLLLLGLASLLSEVDEVRAKNMPEARQLRS
ncbi:MFS transporter [Pseudonocardiaceae bacterium YIM PH 21723]|nr:MFS transporter [Pseudonocardiaceae bacterium YIM PH 21723]